MSDAPRMRLALAGNPNVGKTTLFNALTGQHARVGNYPGVTVERRSGRLRADAAVEVLDLPGTYSLAPRSADERIAHDVLTGRLEGEPSPDAVVCVVDATNLERNLYLVTQVLDLGLPTVVALGMMDAAREAGIEVDTAALSAALGAPVVPVSARRGEGLEALTAAALSAPARADADDGLTYPLMPVVAPEVDHLADTLAEAVPAWPARRRRAEALWALTSDPLLDEWSVRAPAFADAVRAARQRLDARKAPYRQAEMMARYGALAPLVQRITTRRNDPATRTRSDRIDAVVTHRFGGPLLFLAVLALVFQAVFSWATPAMDGIEGVVGWLGAAVRGVLPAGAVADLLVDGVITGVGNVVVFLPQILLLFFFLGLMEDTGYMARTAFIMDRVMRRMGLSGASVVPLLSSYACAIPGIMAARTLPNERDRLLTIMVAPLMSCSARLPVYTLFIAAFIPDLPVLGPLRAQGLAMFSLYLLGTVMAFVAAGVLRRTVFKGEASVFVMELPPYRLPQARLVLRRMVDRAKAFFFRAGKIILGLSVVLWFLAAYPKAPAATPGGASDVGASIASGPVDAPAKDVPEASEAPAAQQQIRHSFVGQFGRAIEPIMRPLGFDWKLSAGLVAAFAAREVMVTALATIYGVGADEEETTDLQTALQNDRYADGRPVYTPLVAVSLLVFFVFALQCMSTLAIARRETNSWKWPAVMWLYMFALAWLSSFVVYQGGRLLGWG
jgi:ferrous iron transport protein B